MVNLTELLNISLQPKKNNKMAIKNETVRRIFDDLDRYRDWCRYEGKQFDEAALYNRNDRNWQQYEKYLSYLEAKNNPRKRTRK